MFPLPRCHFFLGSFYKVVIGVSRIERFPAGKPAEYSINRSFDQFALLLKLICLLYACMYDIVLEIVSHYTATFAPHQSNSVKPELHLGQSMPKRMPAR